MAKYQVECPACNETYTVQLFGPHRDREYRLQNWDWTCDECREKQFKERCRKENEAAAATNEAAGLPALTGSEKQIAWAETIRSKILENVKIPTEAEFEERLKKLEESGNLERAMEEARRAGFDDAHHAFACQVAGVKQVMAETSAHWWIENRDKRWNVMAMEAAQQIAKQSGVDDNTQEAAEAKTEATVRPETPVTETVAEIRPLEKHIEVIFPEKREDFWRIIKKQLGYTWSGSCWKRKITATSTNIVDKAAETGHALLAAGFIVRIFDESIRRAAMTGEFVHDNGRWISKLVTGEHKGWFAICWKEDSNALYQAARKLPGSKWSKPYVVVRAEHFEQVLDFADLYEFNLSIGAQTLADEAQRAKDAAMTASVAAEEHQMPQPGRKPRKLKVPESVEVAEEFRDENPH